MDAVRDADYERLARVLASEAAQNNMSDCYYVPPDEARRAALRSLPPEAAAVAPVAMIHQPTLTAIEARARILATVRGAQARPSAHTDAR